jgi:hypothetical protein
MVLLFTRPITACRILALIAYLVFPAYPTRHAVCGASANRLAFGGFVSSYHRTRNGLPCEGQRYYLVKELYCLLSCCLACRLNLLSTPIPYLAPPQPSTDNFFSAGYWKRITMQLERERHTPPSALDSCLPPSAGVWLHDIPRKIL